MTRIDPIDRVNAARKAVDRAYEELGEAYRAAFPVGEKVAWAHGQYVRSGVVEETCAEGWFPSLLVRSDASGRMLRINPWAVWHHRVGGAS